MSAESLSQQFSSTCKDHTLVDAPTSLSGTKRTGRRGFCLSSDQWWKGCRTLRPYCESAETLLLKCNILLQNRNTRVLLQELSQNLQLHLLGRESYISKKKKKK